MAKLSQIRRLAILINKLSAVRYVPTDALVAHVENTLALYDNKDSNYSQRTMQRDFGLIDEMFGIVIRNDKSRGYYIAELDEMTDNLDVESERALVDALAPLTRGRATWIIAHRLQTLRQVDRIVVMRHGRITASGSYEEIVDDAGHFLEATGREAASYV